VNKRFQFEGIINKLIVILGFINGHTETFSESYYIKPNLDCNLNFPIDLAHNLIPFGDNENDNEIKS